VRIDYDFYGSVGAAGSSLFYVSALGGGAYARRDEAYSAASAAKNLIHTVKSLKTLRHNVKPPLPLKTSTMLARAFSEKGMPIAVSSRTAQSIFQRGLITYPRTDSERLSDEGVTLANEMIMRLYGEKYVGSPRAGEALGRFQGAHEAIRLSDLKPARLWNEEEKNLWSLIDKYFVASRMADAQVDETTLVVTSAIDEFVSRFRTVHNDGFTRHTGETKKLLGNYAAPPGALQGVKPGRRISRVHVSVVEEQDPPPRVLDEASLILACEKEGIGRPSTYSDIIRKLKERAYIDDLDPYEMNYELLGNTVIDPCEDLETNYLEATQRGDKVLGYLLEEHPWVVDKGFTRDVEGMLDQVARGELGYSDVVGVVWQKLTETVPDVASYNEEINSGMRMMP
jgi:DNA topoisomerase-1